MFFKTTKPTLLNLTVKKVRRTILSQHNVKIVKLPCRSKDMSFSIKYTHSFVLVGKGLIVFEYEVLPDSDDTL